MKGTCVYCVVPVVCMYGIDFEMLFIGNECAMPTALNVLWSFVNTDVSQTFKMLTDNKNNVKLFL